MFIFQWLFKLNLYKGFPQIGNQQIPNHFPTFQILIPMNHFPIKAR